MEELEKTKQKIIEKSPKKFRNSIKSTMDIVSTLEEDIQRHLFGTALIIAELGFDTTTIVAALLHDTDRDTEKNEEIQELVSGVRIIEATTKNEDTKDEIIMKYILNNAKDLRSVIIKLASVLDKTRNPELVNEGYKKLYFRQAQTIYSEIAEYLDLGEVKKEIDERVFELTQPIEYQAIDGRYQVSGIDKKLLNRYIGFLQTKTEDLDLKIFGRIKSKYSVYNKLKKYEKEWKAPNIKSIDDLVAFRCITRDVNICYTVLEKLMDNGELNIEKFDDYISNPKPNGYMAIHSLVQFPGISDLEIEVQILTQDMHYTNTYGKASHIAYKASQSRYANPTDKYGWVEEVHKKISKNRENREEKENTPININLFQEDIFAFTPKGEIIPLSKGDTVLDFAYRVHSQIGDSAVAAKVNNKAGKLNQVLETGDMVEIKTQKDKKFHDMNMVQSANSQSTKNRMLRSILKHQKN